MVKKGIMPLFWLSLTGLICIGLLVIWQPYFMFCRDKKTRNADLRLQENLDIYHVRSQAIERQHKEGELSQEEYQTTLLELKSALAQDLPEQVSFHQPKKIQNNHHVAFPTLASILLLLLSCLGYLYLGQGTQFDAAGKIIQAQKSKAVQGIISYIESLRVQIKEHPDDVTSISQLAEVYLEFNLYEQADVLYDRLLQLAPQNPQYKAQKATTLYFIHQQEYTTEVQQLIEEALAQDATQPSALLLLAVHSYFIKDFESALKHWNTLLQSPRTDINLDAIRNAISQVTREIQSSEMTMASKDETKQEAGIHLMITLAPELQHKVQPTDTLFVFAKERQPMPLAVIKQPISSFPIKILLTDQHAMRPDLKLSQAQQVDVTVVVSHSGSIPAKTGDLRGHIVKVNPYQQDLYKIYIDQEVK